MSDNMNWIEEIGKPAFDSISDMVAALECDYDRLEELREMVQDAAFTPEEHAELAEELAELEDEAGDHEDRDSAEQAIHEDPLSIEVRSGWTSLDSTMEAEEFCILLCTGGPAVRIVGELDQYMEPSSARLEVQDWFKPWAEYLPADQDTLLAYCRCFCFEVAQ